MCKNRLKSMSCSFCGEKIGFFLEFFHKKNGEIGFFHPVCGRGRGGLRYDTRNCCYVWEGEGDNGILKEIMGKIENEGKNMILEEKNGDNEILEEKYGESEEKKKENEILEEKNGEIEEKKKKNGIEIEENKEQELEINILLEGRKKTKNRNKR